MNNQETQIYYPTGNEFLSIPTLNEAGEIENINVLSMTYRGLLEICGDRQKQPLMKPVIRIDNQPMTAQKHWSRNNYWIPEWKASQDGIEVEGQICAPLGEKAFYYSFCLTNTSNNEVKIQAGLSGCWSFTYHTVNEQKKMRTVVEVYKSLWNEGVMLEMYGEIPLLALCPMVSHPLTIEETKKEGEVVSYELETELLLAPGETKTVTFFWGVGLEEVSAATAAKELKRQTKLVLEKRTMVWLEEHTLDLNSSQQELTELLNINSFFNYFYALGNTFDTEELVLVTSRSPRYYVSAAYWDRDSMLWSFPAVLLMDQAKARQMLLYVFSKQWRNRGIHSRFIDGTVLEPGFELDELCAPLIALNSYLQVSEDTTILEEVSIKRIVREFNETLAHQKHETLPLYRTFLQPTDDPIVHPYLTYNNVLVWKTLTICASLDMDREEEFLVMAKETERAIWTQMITKSSDGKDMFAWATDLAGNFLMYDEPPGSLQLLAYYGFCPLDHPVIQETINEIRSPKNEHAFRGEPFEELGCNHAEHPWVLGICNSLLSGREEKAVDILLRAPLDNGIACESFHEKTGYATTGDHFATCAGFLAFALYTGLGKKEGENG